MENSTFWLITWYNTPAIEVSSAFVSFKTFRRVVFTARYVLMLNKGYRFETRDKNRNRRNIIHTAGSYTNATKNIIFVDY